MDILFVRNLFRPADFGGNRYPFEVTRRLVARHGVRVVTPRFGGPLPSQTGAEFIHYPTSRRTPFETFFTNAAFSRLAVEREITRRRPDLVVFSSYDVAFGYYAIARRTSIPSVYIYHSSFYSPAVDAIATRPWPLKAAYPALAGFLWRVEKLTFESADAIVAVSPFSRAEIEARLGGSRDTRVIRTIPTGVDTGFFTPGERGPARRLLGLPIDARILLTAGRLAPVKRYDRAIDALALLRREDPRWQLVVLGFGPEEGRLRDRARERGLDDNVTFPGFADSERLLAYYRAADLMLCTSEFENWSLSLLEALSTGTPAIGTPRGSIPDLLGDVDRSLVAEGTDPEDIAAAVRSFFADAARADRVAALARERIVASYSWERTVTELERCFAEAVDPRKR